MVIEEQPELNLYKIERDIKQSFAFHTEREEQAKQLKESHMQAAQQGTDRRRSVKRNTPLMLGKTSYFVVY